MRISFRLITCTQTKGCSFVILGRDYATLIGDHVLCTLSLVSNLIPLIPGLLLQSQFFFPLKCSFSIELQQTFFFPFPEGRINYNFKISVLSFHILFALPLCPPSLGDVSYCVSGKPFLIVSNAHRIPQVDEAKRFDRL